MSVSQTSFEYVTTPLQMYRMPGFTAVKLTCGVGPQSAQQNTEAIKDEHRLFCKHREVIFWNTAHNITPILL